MPHQTFEQHLDGLVTIGVSIQWPYFYHLLQKWLLALEKFHFLFIFLWAASMVETAYAWRHQNTLAIPSLFSNKLGGLQKRTTRPENCYESNLYLGWLQHQNSIAFRSMWSARQPTSIFISRDSTWHLCGRRIQRDDGNPDTKRNSRWRGQLAMGPRHLIHSSQGSNKLDIN